MSWVQFRDADHSLSKRFGIEAIPHYFTIDSDGVLTAEMMGSGSDVEGKLKKLIARAKAAKPRERRGGAGQLVEFTDSLSSMLVQFQDQSPSFGQISKSPPKVARDVGRPPWIG